MAWPGVKIVRAPRARRARGASLSPHAGGQESVLQSKPPAQGALSAVTPRWRTGNLRHGERWGVYPVTLSARRDPHPRLRRMPVPVVDLVKPAEVRQIAHPLAREGRTNGAVAGNAGSRADAFVTA